MNYWHGQIVLRHDGHAETVDARVFLDDDFDLRVEILDCLGPRVFFLGASDITCEIPGVAYPVDLLLSHTSTSNEGEATIVFGPKRTPVWRSSLSKLIRGRAALINFCGFNSKHVPSSQILLNACGWRLTVAPVGGKLLSYSRLLQSDEHKITHQLEFERSDHDEFSDEDMRQLLKDVSLFFSFCHGGWVAVGFAVGMNEDGIVAAEEWGIGRIGPPDEPNGFLDPFHLDGLTELYPLFMEKLSDLRWEDVFSHAVYWLRRANIDHAGPDGGVILIQACSNDSLGTSL